MGTKIFDLVTLTLKFDLLLKDLNLGHSFLIRRACNDIYTRTALPFENIPLVKITLLTVVEVFSND